MNLLFLPSVNVEEFLLRLSGNGRVYYPTVLFDKPHFVGFSTEKKFKPDFRKIRTAENVKHFFFPSRDTVARFPDDIERRAPEIQYLIGVKSCDLRGIDIYDRVFEKWEPNDPFYRAKRSATVIVSADCPEPEKSCFCNFVGLDPYGVDICDVNITALSGGLLFDLRTEKGNSVISAGEGLFQSFDQDAADRERQDLRRGAKERLGQITTVKLRENIGARIAEASDEKMHAARDGCVECFACLHGCPTCYCFQLKDVIADKVVERLRIWDGCYYSAFARVGGGANPRSKIDERFWNRFQCKFNYFDQYENILSCSGCGRCLVGCSAGIDIREILWKL